MRRTDLLMALYADTKVYPLARPRLVKTTGQIYQPKQNQHALIRELENQEIDEAIACPVSVDVEIHLKKETGTHDFPTQRKMGDVDNLLKAVLDAMVTAGLLADDKLVVSANVSKEFDDEDFVVINIWKIAL